jgi:hypothetical protein
VPLFLRIFGKNVEDALSGMSASWSLAAGDRGADLPEDSLGML